MPHSFRDSSAMDVLTLGEIRWFWWRDICFFSGKYLAVFILWRIRGSCVADSSHFPRRNSQPLEVCSLLNAGGICAGKKKKKKSFSIFSLGKTKLF